MVRADKGSIKELSKGRWLVRVSGGKDPETGKRIRLSRTIRGTKTDALNQRTRMLVEVGDIGYVRGSITFGDFVESVFLPRKRQQIERGEFRKNSYLRVEANLRKCGRPVWNVPLNKITPLHIEMCLDQVEGPSARFNAFGDMRAVWSKALTWGFVPKSHDVFSGVERPRKPAPEIETASSELLARILEAFRGHAIEPIVLMMAGCGLRCSEACGLDWECFDWDEGTVVITRGYHKVGGETMFLPPKTVQSGAAVTMPDVVRERMREIRLAARSGRRAASGAIAKMGPNGRRANLATTYMRYIKPGLSADRHSSEVFDSVLEMALETAQNDPK